MGFRVVLFKIDGKTVEQIHQEYEVTATEEHEEFPESPVCGAEIPEGGYLLYINDQIYPDEQVFQKLSQGASLIACRVNETVGSSDACCWMNGVERWMVLHDCQLGPHHLETEGELPKEFEQIRATLFSRQEELDDADYIFDIPVDLFAALGGIRYSEDIVGAGPRPWRVLARIPRKKWWWPFDR